jgi:hypothetical protein
MLVFVLSLFAIFILLGGNEEELAKMADQLSELGRGFVSWNFPRLGNGTAGAEL